MKETQANSNGKGWGIREITETVQTIIQPRRVEIRGLYGEYALRTEVSH